MSAEYAPEGIWSRVDAARVAIEAAHTERDAEAARTSLALALAETMIEGEDPSAAVTMYAKARAAHIYARTNAAAARDELRASRGIEVWSVA